MGGPDVTSDLWKQPFSAVRASGGYPGNGLAELFEENVLPSVVPSTVISHQTSVASVLRHWKYDPAIDPDVDMLLRGMRLAESDQWKMMTQWDLHLVSGPLLWPPLALMGNRLTCIQLDLKLRMLKTCFLLALGTVRRRSFIHALSVAPVHSTFKVLWMTNPQWLCFLGWVPGQESAASPLPWWVTIPGISHLSPDDSERTLYSGQQLYLYVNDTRQFWELVGGGHTCLFLPWNCAFHDIFQSHIFSWIVEVVEVVSSLVITRFQ